MPCISNVTIALPLALSLTACDRGKARNDSSNSPKASETGPDLSFGNLSKADQHVSFDANDDKSIY
jgi:hypothetical protein